MRFGDNRTEKNAAEGPIDRSANADEHGVERGDTHTHMHVDSHTNECA